MQLAGLPDPLSPLTAGIVLIKQKKLKNAPTPTVEKARAEDFEKVYPLLLNFNNPKITKTQWKRLFTDNWNFQEGYRGYKLVLGDEIVGFIAYILSKKLINEKWENFCNLSSWIVKPEYRSSSVDLLYPLLELKNYTIISFTPSVGAYEVETRLFKLKILDSYEVIMPILPRVSALLRKNFKVITRRRNHDEYFLQLLSEQERKIFRDHGKFDCHHVVITSERGNLYMIFKRIYKRHLPFAKLYYMSSPGLFLHHLEDIRFRIPLVLKTAGIVVDCRFLQGRAIHFKKTKNFYMPMLYRSDHLQPHEVDYLYSEFFLLGA
jgi:hypothetical protein